MGWRGACLKFWSCSIFDSYDMKSLWFKFGHDILAGFKMRRLLNKRFLISFHKTAEKLSFQLLRLAILKPVKISWPKFISQALHIIRIKYWTYVLLKKKHTWNTVWMGLIRFEAFFTRNTIQFVTNLVFRAVLAYCTCRFSRRFRCCFSTRSIRL